MYLFLNSNWLSSCGLPLDERVTVPQEKAILWCSQIGIPQKRHDLIIILLDFNTDLLTIR